MSTFLVNVGWALIVLGVLAAVFFALSLNLVMTFTVLLSALWSGGILLGLAKIIDLLQQRLELEYEREERAAAAVEEIVSEEGGVVHHG